MRFWKMHGLGNDYVVIDNRDGKIADAETADLARRLCERRFSVGADGLLLVSGSAVADVKMRIFNADGSEAEMCGNGIRCFTKYCYENSIVRKTELTVETLAGVKKAWLTVERGAVTSVKVDMGAPVLERKEIPMLGEGTCINEDLRVNGETYKVTCLSVGNPHCVIFVDAVDDFPVERIGPKIENHNLFPNRTNVEFAQVLNKAEMKVRVWERGCAETLACGTGACASVAAGNLLRKVAGRVTVHLLGGDLQVEYTDRLFLSGPAVKVFEGTMF
ncbi:diaminopimelate epimerase [Candidatus Bathyarchaeota archaeon A05DMB-2]|jgi:diaminopimelate epimerase|nr:diaminopimelate epimerase [Candidatus Bathyarchaeota archaeon A05DMB-2]